MTRLPVPLGAAVLVLAWPTIATAASLKIGVYSQKVNQETARTGAGISYTSTNPGHAQGQPQGTPPAESTEGSSEPASGRPSPSNPTLPSNSARLSNPHPMGTGSFWYSTVNGERCIYTPASNGICFNVVQAGGSAEPAPPPVNPAVLAATAAEHLSLGPGRIEASPSAHTDGLTGAASWFWLSPSPATRSLSVALRGEHVTVTATASSVHWSFGDGDSVAGGPGVSYRPGAAPAGAVRHDYQTRCLPGDQGRDPYVLASCGANGYTVTATLGWGISYTARGPITTTGGLPARTTSTTLVYPVGEVRAFLTSSGGAG
jgi:hypothetical protein